MLSVTDLDSAKIQHLESEIAEMAAHMTSADHRMLLLIAAFDRRDAWGDWGLRSTAQWLNWRIGLDLGAAREKVRVARALEALPSISSAMRQGQLSYSKVRALTRVATADNEAELLRIAQIGTAAHVEKLVRTYRRAGRLELDTANRQHEQRYLRTYFDDDGNFAIEGRLPAEMGALVQEALEALCSSRESASSTHAQHAADALADMARMAMVASASASRGAQAPVAQVVVHVDADVLANTQAEGRSQIETTDGAGANVSAETARRLACDASVIGMSHDATGRVLDVGRKRRKVPVRLRRALRERDHGCRYPGCTHQRWIDAHHIEHWADGGETNLNNLVELCQHHHRLVHEGECAMSLRRDGEIEFFDPLGRVMPDVGAHPCVDAGNAGDGSHVDWVRDRSMGAGLAVDEFTAMPTWAGESMDYDMAVEGLRA